LPQLEGISIAELTIVKCPRCGADLDVTPKDTNLFCRFCGARVLIEKRPGYVGEDPRRTELEKLKTVYALEKEKIAELNKQKTGLEKEVQLVNEKIQKQRIINAIGIIISSLIIGFCVYLFVIMIYDPPPELCLVFTIMFLILGLIYPIYYLVKGQYLYYDEYDAKNADLKKIEKDIQATAQRISQLEEKIRTC
jgi:DNA-directed RNA polymerase subunit RPC12/RpoP